MTGRALVGLSIKGRQHLAGGHGSDSHGAMAGSQAPGSALMGRCAEYFVPAAVAPARCRVPATVHAERKPERPRAVLRSEQVDGQTRTRQVHFPNDGKCPDANAVVRPERTDLRLTLRFRKPGIVRGAFPLRATP